MTLLMAQGSWRMANSDWPTQAWAAQGLGPDLGLLLFPVPMNKSQLLVHDSMDQLIRNIANHNNQQTRYDKKAL